ncbi:hypothetical protein M404DRAFT_1002585 [Pisolithus tinctorius Marx 270]|uniref:Uncharacterized protein n=1 Tax=Pisolithus tinctorius Marx 270 TaxID=870435 RepID=A0A0C3P3X0_PISTI|nr:hypothetical protein M404DRAFT_1002585 [Pisolithus tinctorius Marx 270]
MTPDAIHAIGLANSKAEYPLHVTSLFIDNRSTIASVNITANLAKHMNEFALVTRYSGESLRPMCEFTDMALSHTPRVAFCRGYW